MGPGLLEERMRVGRLLWSNDISAEYSTADNPKFPKQMNEVGQDLTRRRFCWPRVDAVAMPHHLSGPRFVAFEDCCMYTTAVPVGSRMPSLVARCLGVLNRVGY